MKINCEIVTRESSKTGKPYQALEIEITPNYKKAVFLDRGDLELLKLYSNQNK